MSRLPVPGSDNDIWGNLLNDFLSVEHNTDGVLKIKTDGTLAAKANNSSVVHLAGSETISGTKTFSNSPVVPSPTSGTQAANKTYVDGVVGAGAPDATTSSKGVVQLAGDLAGTATAPTVPGLAGKANTAHTHAIADVTNLQTSLNAKADDTITITGGTSLAGGGNLTANRTLTLLNDAATPGNNRYYGTDGAGAKGYHAIPSGDPAVGGDLTGTASNAQIAPGAIVNADVSASAAIAQSKIANLTTDLAGKTDTSRAINTTNSLAGGGNLTADRTLSLVNDAATPGNNRYYGTDGTGVKGYHTIPSGDPAMGGDLTGTASNAQIAAGAIVNADVSNTAAIAQSKIANLTSDLAGKANTAHTHAIADVTNLQANLDAKADETITITAGTGLTGGGDLSADRTLNVTNDSTTQRVRVSDGGTLIGTRQEINLIEGSNVTITTADNAGANRVDVTIDAAAGAGEANTASNVGVGGVGVFKQKTGVNLEFKNIAAASSKVTITNDGPNNEVDIDVNEANFTGIPQSAVTNLTADLASKATDAGVIHNAIVDAKGDLIAATADDTPARLGVGTDGQFLRADAAQSTGLIWDTVTASEVGAIPASEKGQPNGVAVLDGAGKVTPGQLVSSNITKILPYSNTGTLAVAAGTHRIYNDSGSTWTIQRVRASVGTAPAGSSIIVDVNKNGTTIFTTQANRPTIAAAANTSGAVTNMDVTTVANGEYFTVDIDQVGSTTAGSDLTVQVEVI